MSKLTIQHAHAAREAAAAANTRANEVLEALKKRVADDCKLAQALAALLGGIYCILAEGEAAPITARFRDQLEATARSYGFTLADDPIRKDLVVVTPLEN